MLVCCGEEESATGEWVSGAGWFEEEWGGEKPDMSWIPAACDDNPVYLLHTEGHVALINAPAGGCDPPTGDLPRDFCA